MVRTTQHFLMNLNMFLGNHCIFRTAGRPLLHVLLFLLLAPQLDVELSVQPVIKLDSHGEDLLPPGRLAQHAHQGAGGGGGEAGRQLNALQLLRNQPENLISHRHQLPLRDEHQD